MAQNFDSQQLLSKEVIIESAETNLYRIGLSNYKVGHKSRNKFNQPTIIMIINLLLIVRYSASLIFYDASKDFHLLIGDFSYFIDCHIYFNIAALNITTLAIITQVLHFYYSRDHTELTYLTPFKMIAGIISPKSVGLINEKDVIKLMKVSRILFKLSFYFAEVFIPPAASIVSIVPLYQNSTTFQLLTYGILYTAHWAIGCYHIYSFIVWQITYFCVISYFVTIKLRRVNDNVKLRMLCRFKINSRFVNNISNTLNSLYSEINIYNSNVWSKFLFFVWVTICSIINTLIRTVMYGDTIIILKILFGFVEIMFSVSLILILNNASSASYEAFKSYKILNSYLVSSNFSLKSNRAALKVTNE